MGSLVVMPIPKEFNCNTVEGSNKYISDSDIADIHWRLATNVKTKSVIFTKRRHGVLFQW